MTKEIIEEIRDGSDLEIVKKLCNQLLITRQILDKQYIRVHQLSVRNSELEEALNKINEIIND